MKLYKYIIIIIFLLTYNNTYLSACTKKHTLAPVNAMEKNSFEFRYMQLKPVKLAKIENFMTSYFEFIESYRNPDSSSYPNGCESFSCFASHLLDEEGIDHMLIFSQRHYYLSLKVEIDEGIYEDYIIDFTADQITAPPSEIAPLFMPRAEVKKYFPDQYNGYYKPYRILNERSEIHLDFSYLTYIEIFELLPERIQNIVLQAS